MQILKSGISVVILIEKDSFFDYLINSLDIFSEIPSALLITGKGYPDYNTREFLDSMLVQAPEIPIVYMGDFDPFGIDIYLQYCYGNKNCCFEDFEIPSLFFIGLDGRNFEAAVAHEVSLSVEEISKLHQVLSLDFLKSCPKQSPKLGDETNFQIMKMDEIKQILYYMMFRSKKMELEALEDKAIPYIKEKLGQLCSTTLLS